MRQPRLQAIVKLGVARRLPDPDPPPMPEDRLLADVEALRLTLSSAR
jgi:hypothetical protein